MFDDLTEVSTFDITLPLDLSIRTLLYVCGFAHVDDDIADGEIPSVVRVNRDLTVYLYPIDGNVTQVALSAELQKRGMRTIEVVEALVLVAKFEKLPEAGAPIIVPNHFKPAPALFA